MKRVILAGATDGIGKALAELHASKGYWVAILGRDPAKLDALLGGLSSRFPAATLRGVVCDFRDNSRLGPAFDEAVRAIGHCDQFVYVAGIMHATDGVTSVPEDDAEMFQVNTVAAVQLLGIAGNYFRLAGKGQLVGISSIAGDRGRKLNPAYCASKAGLTTYLEGLRNRLHPFGVQVVTVKPGFVLTKMIAGRSGVFWAASPEEAAATIDRRVDKGHEVFYVYRRWGILGLMLRHIPRFVFKRVGPP
ncbi:MAG: SDR family NAD(P)-dependent oxidoreductase [Thermoanaerobaculia bacterium]|nr:SDR family NAD(P)-dependent oxidoreductase [Thermoanaerobaculia bacterium]